MTGERREGILRALLILVLIAGAGLSIGFTVPNAYEWFGVPPSGTRYHLLQRAALVTALLASVVALAIGYFLPKQQLKPYTEQPLTFRITTLLGATALVAIGVAISRWCEMPVMSIVVVAVAILVLVWASLRSWSAGVRAVALLAAMFLPCIWMVAFNEPIGRTSDLAVGIPMVPAILPAAVVRRLVDTPSVDDVPKIAAGIVILQLLAGGWLVTRGGKAYIAFLLLSLVFASVNSFVMYVLYRA